MSQNKFESESTPIFDVRLVFDAFESKFMAAISPVHSISLKSNGDLLYNDIAIEGDPAESLAAIESLHSVFPDIDKESCGQIISNQVIQAKHDAIKLSNTIKIQIVNEVNQRDFVRWSSLWSDGGYASAYNSAETAAEKESITLSFQPDMNRIFLDANDEVGIIQNKFEVADAEVQYYILVANEPIEDLGIEQGDVIQITACELISVLDETVVGLTIGVKISDPNTLQSKNEYSVYAAVSPSDNFEYFGSNYEPIIKPDFDAIYSEAGDILLEYETEGFGVFYELILNYMRAHTELRMFANKTKAGNERLIEVVTRRTLEILDGIEAELNSFVELRKEEFYYNELRAAVANSKEKVLAYLDDSDMLELMDFSPREATTEELRALIELFSN